jgi:hypothetical protein
MRNKLVEFFFDKPMAMIHFKDPRRHFPQGSKSVQANLFGGEFLQLGEKRKEVAEGK